MDKAFKKNILLYFISHILDIASISLVHSILTILLLEKGLSLSNIVTIQTGYSIAVLIFEFPSGVLGDIFSRKKLNLIAKIFLFMMFLFVNLFNSFILMIFAWFFYGIYAALNSGTLENDIINHLKIKKLDHIISKFIKYQNITKMVTMILASFIGAFIYQKVGINIYLFSIVFLIISFISSYFFCSEQNNKKQKIFRTNDMFKHIKISIQEIKNKKMLKLLLIVSFSSQIFFQTHFQLWQGLFLEKNINENLFPYLYVLFQIISIVAYNYPINKYNSKFKSNILFKFIPFILLLPFVLVIKQNILFLITYGTLILVLTIVEYISDYIFSKTISIKSISALTSLKSVTSRISSIIILLLSGLFINHFDVLTVVIFNFILSILLILITFKQFKIN